jgi:glycosyltransferase involved in cell wall biosynthesis/ubiquinone/menaquinone biosynthesis C-methylase UbiE
MKILSILTYYHPHWTGLTAYAKRIAEGLAARGHQVTVLTTQHDPQLPREEMHNGVRIIRIRPVARISRGLISFEYPFIAARLIREHDVVQIHTPLMESWLIALFCKMFGRPLLMTHHGDLVMPAGLINQIIERVVVAMMTLAEHLSARISIHSRDYAENSDFLWRFKSKLAYIYPPTEIPEPQIEAARAWRRELGLENKKLIGFAGRFVEEKGFDYLLQAIPKLIELEPDAHLVYAGDHNVVYEKFFDQCKPLVEKYRDRITFVGLLRDQQRLANFYALCDVFAIPSRTDCFPSVQIEVMLCGTPLVTADIPGAREPIRVTGMGMLVAPRNPTALAEGLARVLRDRACYVKSRAEVRAVFDPVRSVDEYEALSARLIGQPAPTSRATPRPVEPEFQIPVPVVRYRNGTRPHASLNADDYAILDRVLRNEADTAYRRRALMLLDYLELKDGDRIFDCGCGFGFYSMMMSKLRRVNLIGLDGDVTRLQWAQREHNAASFLSGDILQLPFPDGAFDKVLMTEVLEHLTDDRKGLQEIFRLLKPGGVLALSVPNTNYPFWWDPINRVWTGIGGEPFRTGPIVGIWSNHERLYRVEEVVERIANAGFTIEAVEEATHYSFPFMNFIVYGIGKPLIEKNLLPASVRASADRLRGEQNTGNPLNPINLARAMFNAVDRWNDRPEVAQKKTFMNVLVKARKPIP